MKRKFCWVIIWLAAYTISVFLVAGQTEVPKGAKAQTAVEENQVVRTEVLVNAVGDCTIGSDESFSYEGTLPAVLEENNNDMGYLFSNVSAIFKNDDITVANLETTFTTANKKADKTFRFKGSPEYAKAFVLGSIEGVNISNNHIYDYLEQGFEDTKATLTNVSVAYFGEGNSWIKEVKGQKIGFVGYLGFYYDESLLYQIASDIKKLKEQGCTVVASFHWGVEGSYYPDDEQVLLAHHAIDSGADFVLGHHPHVIQGIENYNGRFIVYSMGNFCFGGNANPFDKDTFISQVKFIYENGQLISCGLKVVPSSISSVNFYNDYCPTPLEGENKARVLTKLNDLSLTKGLNIGDDFYYLMKR